LELNLQTLPTSLSWLPRLSFCSYAFEVLLTTELEGTTVLVEIPGAPPVRLGAQARLPSCKSYQPLTVTVLG
jgi:hypothetical protein